MRLVLELRPDAIRVAVTDGAAGDVVRNPNPHTHVGGRGLHIVQELSDRWGVDPADGDAKGKTVWAEWQLPR